MKTLKEVLKETGINNFIAIKKHYIESIDKNDFYKMLQRRLKFNSPKGLASFLKYELHYHFKECVQYQ